MTASADKYRISPTEFLAPWVRHLRQFLGSQAQCNDLLLTHQSPFYLAATAILESISNPALSPRERKKSIAQADHLVDVLAGEIKKSAQVSGLGAALLPEEFWETTSGRVIITLFQLTMGNKFCTVAEAIRLMPAYKRRSHRIYELIYIRALPAYPGFHGKRKRIRMDHLDYLLALDKKKKESKGKLKEK